jgi:hypothetical protein
VAAQSQKCPLYPSSETCYTWRSRGRGLACTDSFGHVYCLCVSARDALRARIDDDLAVARKRIAACCT